MVYMFLNGGGMKGGPLHHLLRGAPFVGLATTAPLYRLNSVGDDHPAMQLAYDGAKITGELYDVELRTLRESLLPAEPDELELGVVGLEGGREALGMLLRANRNDMPDLVDITEYGSWRAYLATKGITV